MHFDTSLLTTADQTALAAAIAGIPGVLAPLSAAIATAQAAAAPVVSLKSQIAALTPVGPAGMMPPSLTDLCNRVLVAEAAAASAAEGLHHALQQCEPLVAQQLLPLALHQALTEIQAANSAFVPAGAALDPTLAAATPFYLALGGAFRTPFSPNENSIVPLLARATKLQMLLQNIEAGTDFFSL